MVSIHGRRMDHSRGPSDFEFPLEIAALDPFQRDPCGLALVDQALVADAQDVGMAEGGSDFGLTQPAFAGERGVALEGDDLERDQFIGFAVAGLSRRSHCRRDRRRHRGRRGNLPPARWMREDSEDWWISERCNASWKTTASPSSENPKLEHLLSFASVKRHFRRKVTAMTSNHRACRVFQTRRAGGAIHHPPARDRDRPWWPRPPRAGSGQAVPGVS